ncbi:uncharacterized protein C1orf112 homolog [Sinocyclocheilus anshuiensis]|uniref:uncharacterized protein C1orf112 homolog n=1 Tax=Sinocyclocheilus anshuiensis TaxID=1608454 RepID=UPI0007BA5B1C|nr:PREDICTED: uncharacterized protein C1orf112 homolog [Sinocyclocheilus anshuiensis]
MCRFFANTLVHYTKEFKAFLAKSCCRFHRLYLQIRSKFPPSVCAPSVPSALSEELRVAVLVPMDAMLTQLLSFRPFAESVLDPDHRAVTISHRIAGRNADGCLGHRCLVLPGTVGHGRVVFSSCSPSCSPGNATFLCSCGILETCLE